MRVRSVAMLLGTLLSAACFTAGRAAKTFAFESFERRLSSDTDVDGASRSLSSRLPVGTDLASYDAFFAGVGGSCAEVADTQRFPNTSLCVYAHGYLIRAEWRFVVRFDPATGRSIAQTLSYGLTGL